MVYWFNKALTSIVGNILGILQIVPGQMELPCHHPQYKRCRVLDNQNSAIVLVGRQVISKLVVENGYFPIHATMVAKTWGVKEPCSTSLI